MTNAATQEIERAFEDAVERVVTRILVPQARDFVGASEVRRDLAPQLDFPAHARQVIALRVKS